MLTHLRKTLARYIISIFSYSSSSSAAILKLSVVLKTGVSLCRAGDKTQCRYEVLPQNPIKFDVLVDIHRYDITSSTLGFFSDSQTLYYYQPLPLSASLAVAGWLVVQPRQLPELLTTSAQKR